MGADSLLLVLLAKMRSSVYADFHEGQPTLVNIVGVDDSDLRYQRLSAPTGHALPFVRPEAPSSNEQQTSYNFSISPIN